VLHFHGSIVTEKANIDSIYIALKASFDWAQIVLVGIVKWRAHPIRTSAAVGSGSLIGKQYNRTAEYLIEEWFVSLYLGGYLDCRYKNGEKVLQDSRPVSFLPFTPRFTFPYWRIPSNPAQNTKAITLDQLVLAIKLFFRERRTIIEIRRGKSISSRLPRSLRSTLEALLMANEYLHQKIIIIRALLRKERQ